MRIRLDLHVHTTYSFDSTIEPAALREICRERGLDGVAVTDHDSLRGSLEFASGLPDLIVVPGSEIRSAEGEIIGLFLSEEVPPGLSARETMRRIHEQGGVVIVPHPFDIVKLKRMRARRLEELLGEIDAMEHAGLKCNPNDGVIVISFDATRLALKYCLEGRIALSVECNPLQGPYVDATIKRLNRGETVEREKYINETQFDFYTITQDMIDRRDY
jgi:hypothetical protein